MKKIKVIFTGGTIGSLATGNDINPDSKSQYLLLQKYGKNLDRFELCSPLSILSENANFDNVLAMTEEIKKSEKEDCEGIILTHGTDTLAFTGAYLSFLLPELTKPVVMVSSDYILTDEKANGNINFSTAVELLDCPNLKPAIYVAYKNSEDDFVSIHLAVRMREPQTDSASFSSPEGNLFATYKDGKFQFLNTKIERNSTKFEFLQRKIKKGLFVHPYLGLDYNVYKNVECDFVLHNLYHSGTSNTKDAESEIQPNFLKFAEQMKKQQIPVFLCNIRHKELNYNSTNLMLEKQIIPLYNVLDNVAMAKLMVAFSFLEESARKEYLNSCICGEFLI